MWLGAFATAKKVGYLNNCMHQDNCHYGVKQRLEFLKLCEEQPERVTQHDQRVRTIKVAVYYFWGLLTASVCSTSQHAKESLIFGNWKTSFRNHTSDVGLLIQAANTFYEKSEFERAEELYRKALAWGLSKSTLSWLGSLHNTLRSNLKVQEV